MQIVSCCEAAISQLEEKQKLPTVLLINNCSSMLNGRICCFSLPLICPGFVVLGQNRQFKDADFTSWNLQGAFLTLLTFYGLIKNKVKDH